MSGTTADDADLWNDINFDDPDLIRLLDDPLQLDKSKLRADDHFVGFDNNVGDTWIYPSNMPLRSYQYNIAHAALLRNTLVVLPTGLGKTFIAAVVMYNLYRWYPNSKVIFMAPTRPLVAQQIEACQKIMPFPAADTVELTGKLNKNLRTELWQSKRVFFATPQVVQSDIVSAEQEDEAEAVHFPFNQVKLIVVDEAHKARGRYAYTEVTQALHRRNRYFRVLALSATPGRNNEDVAEVVRNLLISHLEVRCDNSIDVSTYVHKRSMTTVVVELSAEIQAVRDELLLIIDPYLRQLVEADVLSGSLTSITRNWLLFEQKRFRERSMHQRHEQQSAVSSNFSICISLYHALELLERHGTRVFLNNFEQDADGRDKFVTNMDLRLRRLIERLRREVGPNPFEVSAHAMTNGEIAQIPAHIDFGHPKFERARACLLDHFESHPESRAIVFCEYRESVSLIYRLLLQHRPMLKPRCFVGQGGTTGSLRALTQKQQIQVMTDFRAGTANILIATSIGEEGIDVGEVDLIVCFDISTTNPTRFIQRIGRTGRQKQGKVVMLVTAGKEEALLKDVLSQKDQTNKKLGSSSVVAGALYKNSPRMVPTAFNPQCLKMFIKPPDVERAKTTGMDSKKAAASKSKKQPLTTAKGSQDLRKFFKRKVELSPEEQEVFAEETPSQRRISTNKSISKVNNYFEGLDLLQSTSTQLMASGVVNDKPKIDETLIRKLNKCLKSTQSCVKMPPETDLLTTLRSPSVLLLTKRMILFKNVEFVRETHAQMKVLRALDNTDDAEAVEPQIRANYKLLEEIFDGGDKLETWLEDLEMQEYKQQCSQPDDDRFGAIFDSFNSSRLDHIFEGIEEGGFGTDNYDYIEEQFKQTRRYKLMCAEESVHQAVGGESMVYDTAHHSNDYSPHFDDDDDAAMQHVDYSMTESKYCSQWDAEFAKKDDIAHKSTPVQGVLAKAFARQEVSAKCIGKKPTNLLAHFVPNGDSFSATEQTQELSAICIDVASDSTPDDLQLTDALSSVLTKSTPAKNFLAPVVEPALVAKTTVAEMPPPTISVSKKSLATKPVVLMHPPAKPVLIKPVATTFLPTKPVVALSVGATHLPTTSAPIKLVATTPTFPSAAVTTQKTVPPTAAAPKSPTTKSLLDELELDLDMFLEPFPEEQELLKAAAAAAAQKNNGVTRRNSAKENLQMDNINNNNKQLLDAAVPSYARHSPDLFEIDNEPSPLQRPSQKKSLAAKLAANRKQLTSASNNNTSNEKLADVLRHAKMPSTKTLMSVNSSAFFTPKKEEPKSPARQTEPIGLNNERSPSIFDIYMKNMQRMARRQQTPSIDTKTKETTEAAAEESMIVRKRSVASKRKIFDSDSEHDQGPADDAETSGEEIKATQQNYNNSYHNRVKRRRMCSFIEQEAGVSGSDASEDEADYTLGHYIHDSVVVSSDEADDDASTSHMQAMYLQSLKSPQKQRGAFKIPAFKVYNDHSKIFSQAVPVDASEYIKDSFVVSEDEDEQADSDVAEDVQEVSMCPLERAERILKERRRAKRQKAQLPDDNVRKKKRKVIQIIDSSDDDFE